MSELQNAKELVRDYEKSMDNATSISGRLARTTTTDPLNTLFQTTISTSSNGSSQTTTPPSPQMRGIRRSTRKKKPRGRDWDFWGEALRL
jgi:hypothetical protein